MSRLCDRCGRGANRANTRSHSNIATKVRQFANLQSRKIGGIKMKVCTGCLRTIAKTLSQKTGASA